MGEAASGKTKADEGGGGTTLDKVLSKLDSIHTRMDAIEAKADQAVADARKRTTVRVGDDGDLTLQHEGSEKPPVEVQGGEPPPMKPDAKGDGKGRKDEWPDKDKDKDDSKGRKDQFPPPDEDKEKADAAAKAKADKAKADAAKARKDEGKGEDEQEAEIAKGDTRADAIIARMADRIAKLESRDTMADDDVAKYADAQARADEVSQLFGKQAKRWLTGESLGTYRRRLATEFRIHSPQWKDVKMSDLPDGAFDNIEKAIYADAAAAALSPTDLGDGEFRKVTKTDPDTGLKQIHWYGNHSFIKDLGRPGRRVVGFRNRNMA
jgi:hypothetical protein